MKIIGQMRDESIYNFIKQGGVFSQEQIEQAVLYHLKPESRRRKSYECLGRMTKRKQITKVREFRGICSIFKNLNKLNTFYKSMMCTVLLSHKKSPGLKLIIDGPILF
jgi:hypothetical protein